MGFDLVAFIRDDEVRFPVGQFRFHQSCRFIVDHSNLQLLTGECFQSFGFLGLATRQDRELIVESGIAGKFVSPDRHHRKRSDDQNVMNLPFGEEPAGDTDGRERFSSTHFHKESGPTTFDSTPIKAKQGGYILVSLRLVPVWGNDDRHLCCIVQCFGHR